MFGGTPLPPAKYTSSSSKIPQKPLSLLTGGPHAQKIPSQGGLDERVEGKEAVALA
jgi:hypothetical protein